MSLRDRVPDSKSMYEPPIFGVDLRTSEVDLRPGQARLMKNCMYRGGIRKRYGSTQLTASALHATLPIRGGHMFYYGGATPAKKRLVAYNTKISVISDAGAETELTSGMTADKDTGFLTWSIQDSVYIWNSNDTIRSYDGTTFATVSGTAIPTARWMCPILDRLFAITTNGIERTDPRDPTVWSNDSSWATIRPSLSGLFSCIHPHTIAAPDQLYPGVLAFQPTAHYIITGTNFGDDVTAGSASAGEDASIKLLDPRVGTQSPYSVTTIPGFGTFFFTTDLNVFYIPFGSTVGRYLGDRIYSTGSTAGLESTNQSALSAVWGAYFDRFFILGIPTGSNAYTDTQWWLDLYSLGEYPDRGPVWYGPMTGQSLMRVWVEDQQGDYKLKGGEGNTSTGAFVYNQHQTTTFTDAVGTADNNISMSYQTYFNHFGAPSRRKYVPHVEMDLNSYSGNATCTIADIDGDISAGLPIEQLSR